MTAATTVAAGRKELESPCEPEGVPAELGQVVKFYAPEVVFGPDTLGEAGYAASRLAARRPFVVTDPGIVEGGLGRGAPSTAASRGPRPGRVDGRDTESEGR